MAHSCFLPSPGFVLEDFLLHFIIYTYDHCWNVSTYPYPHINVDKDLHLCRGFKSRLGEGEKRIKTWEKWKGRERKKDREFGSCEAFCWRGRVFLFYCVRSYEGTSTKSQSMTRTCQKYRPSPCNKSEKFEFVVPKCTLHPWGPWCEVNAVWYFTGLGWKSLHTHHAKPSGTRAQGGEACLPRWNIRLHIFVSPAQEKVMELLKVRINQHLVRIHCTHPSTPRTRLHWVSSQGFRSWKFSQARPARRRNRILCTRQVPKLVLKQSLLVTRNESTRLKSSVGSICMLRPL